MFARDADPGRIVILCKSIIPGDLFPEFMQVYHSKALRARCLQRVAVPVNADSKGVPSVYDVRSGRRAWPERYSMQEYHSRAVILRFAQEYHSRWLSRTFLRKYGKWPPIKCFPPTVKPRGHSYGSRLFADTPTSYASNRRMGRSRTRTRLVRTYIYFIVTVNPPFVFGNRRC